MSSVIPRFLNRWDYAVFTPVSADSADLQPGHRIYSTQNITVGDWKGIRFLKDTVGAIDSSHEHQALKACSLSVYPVALGVVNEGQMYEIPIGPPWTDYSYPGTPTLASPANGATGIPINPILSWNAAYLASSYTIQVSADSNFTTTIISQSVTTGTSYSVNVLLTNDTKYYWRVNSTNKDSTSAWSSVWSFKTVISTPVFSSPSNGAAGTVLNPTISWIPVSGATSYTLQVSTVSNFSILIVDQSNITDSLYNISGLNYNTQYYMRMKATNAEGTTDWSTVWTFTTILIAPTLSSPPIGAGSIPLNVKVSWNSCAGATSYNLQVSDMFDFSNLVVNKSNITATADSVKGLSSFTQYYWRTSATNTGGTSDWSSIWNFTTVLAAPSAPILSSPSNGAIDIETNPTFMWNSSPTATSYSLQVSTTSDFANLVVNQSNITNNFYTISGLNNNTQYYWRVNAKNAGGTSAWPTAWSFTTFIATPAQPVLFSPANIASGVSLTPKIIWKSSTGATSYTLQVSTTSDFANLVINQGGITDTSFAATGLSNNTQYYWRTNAVNAGGTSARSSIWSFTTIVAVPAIPVLSSPASGTIGNTVNPTLKWNVSSGSVSYTLQISVSSDF